MTAPISKKKIACLDSEKIKHQAFVPVSTKAASLNASLLSWSRYTVALVFLGFTGDVCFFPANSILS